VGEAALHQLIGGTAVMSAQLRHLQNLPPSAAVRILPYGSGVGLLSSFEIFDIGERGRLTVAISDLFGQLVYEEDDERVAQQTVYFDALWQRALPPADSRELIGRILSDVEE
jgi:hypothetical protein